MTSMNTPGLKVWWDYNTKRTKTTNEYWKTTKKLFI